MENIREKIEVQDYIPLQNLESLRNKLKVLNSRAKKLGFDPIEISYGDKKRKKTRIAGEDIEYTVVLCTIRGEYPGIPGYKFLAKIEARGESNLVLALNDEFNPEWSRMNRHCDHCKSNRNRKETYLVKKEEDGSIHQIGSSCVDQFIGSESLSSISFRASLVEFFSPETKEVSEDIQVQKVVAAEDFLACAIAHIRHFGFVSKQSTRASKSMNPTSIAAFDRVTPILSEDKRDKFDPSDEDFELAKSAIKNIDDVLAGSEESIDSNLRVIYARPDIIFDDIFMAALFAIKILKKYGSDTKMIKKESEKKEVIPGNFLGAVGEKITALVRVGKKMNFESRYSSRGTNMIIMIDENENTIVTMTSGDFNPQEGAVMEIQGTVKEHKTYRGVNQTTVQRVKVTKCPVIEKFKKSLEGKAFRMTFNRSENKWGDEDIRSELDALCKASDLVDYNSDVYHKISTENPKNTVFFLTVKSASSKSEAIELSLIAKKLETGLIEFKAEASQSKK